MGAPGEDGGAGAVFVFYGSAAGLDLASATWFRFGHIASPERTDLNVAGSRFGAALLASDVDNDGDDDLVVGAPGAGNGAGAVAILRSNGSGIQDDGVRLLQSDSAASAANEAGDGFGSALTAADFDGDLLLNLAIGAPGEDSTSATDSGEGVFSIMLGRREQLPRATTYRRQTACGGDRARGDRFGATLAHGDFDGDGRADLAVAAPGDVRDGVSAGSLCIFAGRLLTSGDVATWTGRLFDQVSSAQNEPSESGDLFGASLGAGDFDADGYDDLVVGVPGESDGSQTSSGGLVTLPGSSAGLLRGKRTLQSHWRMSAEASDQFGFAVLVANLDGSGAADVVVGAPGEAVSGEGTSGFVSMQFGTGHDAPMLALGPLLGEVRSNAVKVWVRASRDAQYRVRYRVAGTTSWTTPTGSVGLSSQADRTGTYTLTGLVPDTAYQYEALLDGAARARGTFRTLPTSPNKLTFGVAADFGWSEKPFVLLDALAREQPAFALFLGDNVYADSSAGGASAAVTQRQYEDRYAESWGDPAMRAFLSRVPTLMTWDDRRSSTTTTRGSRSRVSRPQRPPSTCTRPPTIPRPTSRTSTRILQPRTAGRSTITMRSGACSTSSCSTCVPIERLQTPRSPPCSARDSSASSSSG